MDPSQGLFVLFFPSFNVLLTPEASATPLFPAVGPLGEEAPRNRFFLIPPSTFSFSPPNAPRSPRSNSFSKSPPPFLISQLGTCRFHVTCRERPCPAPPPSPLASIIFDSPPKGCRFHFTFQARLIDEGSSVAPSFLSLLASSQRTITSSAPQSPLLPWPGAFAFQFPGSISFFVTPLLNTQTPHPPPTTFRRQCFFGFQLPPPSSPPLFFA